MVQSFWGFVICATHNNTDNRQNLLILLDPMIENGCTVILTKLVLMLNDLKTTARTV